VPRDKGLDKVAFEFAFALALASAVARHPPSYIPAVTTEVSGGKQKGIGQKAVAFASALASNAAAFAVAFAFASAQALALAGRAPGVQWHE
jgi:hypothetical protein